MIIMKYLTYTPTLCLLIFFISSVRIMPLNQNTNHNSSKIRYSNQTNQGNKAIATLRIE